MHNLAIRIGLICTRYEKRFSDGKVSLPYGQFLGYEKGEDGLPKIVEKEAEVVRKIYRFFLKGS